MRRRPYPRVSAWSRPAPERTYSRRRTARSAGPRGLRATYDSWIKPSFRNEHTPPSACRITGVTRRPGGFSVYTRRKLQMDELQPFQRPGLPCPSSGRTPACRRECSAGTDGGSRTGDWIGTIRLFGEREEVGGCVLEVGCLGFWELGVSWELGVGRWELTPARPERTASGDPLRALLTYQVNLVTSWMTRL